ncbi:helix-turn-helix family protein [Glaesserella parasuis SW114]|nr:helix-turn-helix family protein [Glaesserella parasuis SW114]
MVYPNIYYLPTQKEFFMKFTEQIRHNIRNLREERQLTQAMMAERLNLSETGYAKIERGETQVSLDRLPQIAEVLNVEWWELFRSDEAGINIGNYSHSSNISLAFGSNSVVLEAEIKTLKTALEAKNEILNSREREIKSLESRIESLEKMIEILENK